MDSLKLTAAEKETLTSRGYQLLSKLGEGAYAQVYLSTYKESTAKLACKIVDVPKSSATYVNKFLPRELNILTAIKSPHIVHIHSIFRRNLKYFIFMRFAEKGDLMDCIIANGAIPQVQARFWSKQIVSGIQYLHKNRIAHRDIKCENILITEKNNIKLTDFGFSRYIIESDSKASFSETFCGSLLYVAPEIVKGVAYNPFKSDIWSLGVVIFTMLNRTVPFNETNPSVIYELQMNQKYRFHDPDPLFDNVKNLIKLLLQPEPKKRPSIDAILQHDWLTVDTPTQGKFNIHQKLFDTNTPKEVNTDEKDTSTEKNSMQIFKSNEHEMKHTKKADTSLEDIMKTDDSSSEDIKTIGANQNQKDKEAKHEDTVASQHTGFQIISKSMISTSRHHFVISHQEKIGE